MTRSVKTVSPDTRIGDVVSAMCLYRISGLPVVEDGILIGMVAEKDVLQEMFPTIEDLMSQSGSIDLDAMMDGYKNIIKRSVRDLMSSKPVSVPPDMHVLKASAIMVSHRFRRIPVAEGNKLVGMMSLGDVHKAIYQRNVDAAIKSTFA